LSKQRVLTIPERRKMRGLARDVVQQALFLVRQQEPQLVPLSSRRMITKQFVREGVQRRDFDVLAQFTSKISRDRASERADEDPILRHAFTFDEPLDAPLQARCLSGARSRNDSNDGLVAQDERWEMGPVKALEPRRNCFGHAKPRATITRSPPTAAFLPPVASPRAGCGSGRP